jgi:hypothetical protein
MRICGVGPDTRDQDVNSMQLRGSELELEMRENGADHWAWRPAISKQDVSIHTFQTSERRGIASAAYKR